MTLFTAMLALILSCCYLTPALAKDAEPNRWMSITWENDFIGLDDSGYTNLNEQSHQREKIIAHSMHGPRLI